ncbi:MAG: alpha-ketoacid dehydrogenase subunit beta, partial [Vulcanimicrobiaceae bacterium]
MTATAVHPNGASTSRSLTYVEALREALDQSLASDDRVYLMGLGVPDPKGIFGTTLGLQEKYGDRRVLDMPTAENGMTGVAIGSALVGMRPVMVHQRVDFALLALDQLVNNAAKWHYMFGGKQSVPLVVRLIVGRGWGQGPQHSQALQALFAHIPGLKVVAPATPHDAKGMLLAAIDDDDPVIFFEHRWLHPTFGHVPPEPYRVPLGKAHIAREGRDVTLISSSYFFIECLAAADALQARGIDVELIDLRTIRPLDRSTLIDSARKTGRVVVVDGGWRSFGVAAEIVAAISE